MKRQKIKSFSLLKHGDLIISPIDNEGTSYYVDKDNESYLANEKCIYPIFQFDADDFYHYDGYKNIGEKDKSYFI